MNFMVIWRVAQSLSWNSKNLVIFLLLILKSWTVRLLNFLWIFFSLLWFLLSCYAGWNANPVEASETTAPCRAYCSNQPKCKWGVTIWKWSWSRKELVNQMKLCEGFLGHSCHLIIKQELSVQDFKTAHQSWLRKYKPIQN